MSMLESSSLARGGRGEGVRRGMSASEVCAILELSSSPSLIASARGERGVRGDRSDGRGTLPGTARDALEAYERIDDCESLRPWWWGFPKVCTEPLGEAERREVNEPIDILERWITLRSCWLIGDGPGTGGKGPLGGSDGGGFPDGEGGMYDGGVGKSSSRSGTASCDTGRSDDKLGRLIVGRAERTLVGGVTL